MYDLMCSGMGFKMVDASRHTLGNYFVFKI